MLSVSASRASSIRSDDEGSGADEPEQPQAGDGQSGDGSGEDLCMSTAVLLGKRKQLKPSADDFQPEIYARRKPSPHSSMKAPSIVLTIRRRQTQAARIG